MIYRNETITNFLLRYTISIVLCFFMLTELISVSGNRAEHVYCMNGKHAKPQDNNLGICNEYADLSCCDKYMVDSVDKSNPLEMNEECHVAMLEYICIIMCDPDIIFSYIPSTGHHKICMAYSKYIFGLCGIEVPIHHIKLPTHIKTVYKHNSLNFSYYCLNAVESNDGLNCISRRKRL